MASYRLVSSRRHAVVAGVVLVLLLGVLTFHLAARARGADVPRCERFQADSIARSREVAGAGQRVVVIGDSYSAGLGLDTPRDSWPSRLVGEVHVAGFSGSGFSRGASTCRGVSFATRAPAALRGGADLVVVEGGLNDYDQPDTDIRAGFARLMDALEGRRVVVVGPPMAPSRAAAVPHVDRLLAGLAAAYDVDYVPTSGLDLTYLDDDLHLTPAGHRAFGDAVAGALARLP